MRRIGISSMVFMLLIWGAYLALMAYEVNKKLDNIKNNCQYNDNCNQQKE